MKKACQIIPDIEIE